MNCKDKEDKVAGTSGIRGDKESSLFGFKIINKNKTVYMGMRFKYCFASSQLQDTWCGADNEI